MLILFEICSYPRIANRDNCPHLILSFSGMIAFMQTLQNLGPIAFRIFHHQLHQAHGIVLNDYYLRINALQGSTYQTRVYFGNEDSTFLCL